MEGVLYSKIRGGLWGVAIGDALGATLEHRWRDEIKAKYGQLREIVGGGWLDLKPGQWTDDAEMTLAVAEGIIEYPKLPVEPIGDRFLKWYRKGPIDIGHHRQCH